MTAVAGLGRRATTQVCTSIFFSSTTKVNLAANLEPRDGQTNLLAASPHRPPHEGSPG